MNIYSNEFHLYKSPISVVWDLTCINCLNVDETINIARQIVEDDVIILKIITDKSTTTKKVINEILPTFSKRDIIIDLCTPCFEINDNDINIIKELNVHIEISLYGSNERTHDNIIQIPGSFINTLFFLTSLKNINQKVKVIYFINKQNFMQVDEVFKLAKDNDNIFAVEVYIDNIKMFFSSLFPPKLTAAQHKEIFEKVLKYSQENTQQLKYFLNDSLAIFRAKVKQPNHSLFLQSNGNVLADKYLPIVFGDSRSDKLIDIWKRGLNNCWRDPKIKDYILNVKSEILIENNLVTNLENIIDSKINNSVVYSSLESCGGNT